LLTSRALLAAAALLVAGGLVSEWQPSLARAAPPERPTLALVGVDEEMPTDEPADKAPAEPPDLAAAQPVDPPPDSPADSSPAVGADPPAGTATPSPGAPDPPTLAGSAAPVPTAGGTYVVQAGDTLSSIARRTNISVDVLVAANNLPDPDAIQQGQALTIPVPKDSPPAPQVTASPRPVPAQTAVPTPAAVARPATGGPPPPAFGPTPRTTTPATPTVTPAPALVSTAAPLVKPTATATPAMTITPSRVPQLAWPIALKPPLITITQPFLPTHSGIDISAPLGTPIKAAAGGVVKLAEKGDGPYGWRMVIDHGDGTSTWYAHMSAFAVGEGDRVQMGQVIGSVGSSGMATGPHLHFEVRVNNTLLNPRLALP